MNNVLLYTSFLIFVYVNILFIYSLVHKRNDVADIGWGIGFLIIALASLNFDYHFRGALDIRSVIFTALVAIWSIRLSSHIWIRNRKKSEDWRYNQWREEWGKLFYVRSYLQVYILQGIFMLLVSLPVMYGITTHYPIFPTVFDVLGILVFIIGFLYETVSDAQLARFLKNPDNKGKLMTSGLWRFSRHPNYFGEITLWWGIFLITLNTPAIIFTFVGPLCITLLITKVSGVPLLEKKFESHPDWEEYKKNVSKLIPLHPGKKIIG